jgi:uncharacterized protein YbjT (DUF2867 family)
VVDGLLRAGQRVRVALRTGEWDVPGAERVVFDFHDQGTWAQALDGVDRIFLMRPPAISDINGVLPRSYGPRRSSRSGKSPCCR